MFEHVGEIPEELIPILSDLERLDEIKGAELKYRERALERRRRIKRFSGRDLLRNATREEILHPSLEHPYSLRGTPVNVIPPYGKPGSCTRILLVFVGETDNFKVRILEAIEHCGVLCRGMTNYVIFYTMKWNDVVWKKHENSFRLIGGLTVVQKPFGRTPIRIL